MRGSLLRVPLAGDRVAGELLSIPDEVRQALWPSFFESHVRKDQGPVSARLPDDCEAVLMLELAGAGLWGSPLDEPLSRYLAANRAAAGGSLLVRVLDAVAHQAEAWLEPRRERDEAAVARRNEAIAGAAYEFLGTRRTPDVFIWDIANALLARGINRADVAPDTLQAVLDADARFVSAGLSSWLLAERMTPAMRAMIRERERLEPSWPGIQTTPAAAPETGIQAGQSPFALLERLLADLGLAAPAQATAGSSAPAIGVTSRSPRSSTQPARGRRSTGQRAAAIYQLKVTLRGAKPPIWRRRLLPAGTRLSSLHTILQVAMGWTGSHLHQFEVGPRVIGVPNDDDWQDVEDERKVKLADIAPREKARFRYEYDFGDGWEHDIVVEKVLPPQEGARYPTCVTGQGACPPEDVGGIWGYAEFLEAIQDPNHPEHDAMLEWAGGDFDPQDFDLDEVNAALHRLRV